ncbi:MAG: M1 family aminopeptidase [Saprospiraceae bacterium]
MWYEIFKFELKYRAKRWDTYLYFFALFGYALIAVDFLFGQDLGAVKLNAPYLIALTMGIVSALFMMMVSMIMGVAALRDFDHNMESLMFINPIKKSDYLIGRFLGSFLVLLFIFSGLFLGLIAADFMPWRTAEELLPFSLWKYLQPTLFIALPNLFFGGALFFIGGAVSRKLLVVYTQGILLLTVYILGLQLTQNNDYQFLASWIDLFGYQTIKNVVKYWSVAERNTRLVPMSNLIIYNRLIWLTISGVILIIGYQRFSFNVVRDKFKGNSGLWNTTYGTPTEVTEQKENGNLELIPDPIIAENFFSKLKQLIFHALFYAKSIFKETPFWAIVICGMAIIFINSISLGTSYGVDSYPLTFIIVEDLQEMSIFFFLLILIFYSGELVWKERDIKLNGIYDVLPVSSLINLSSKLIGLVLTYLVIMLAIILAGIIFQTTKGYFNYELEVYFSGFFIEIFPYLVLLTMVSFFFQVLANHKFIGHLLVVSFLFFVLIGAQIFDFDHGLYSYGAGDLGQYSDMNGYGHYWQPYCWFMLYWFAFSALLFLIAVLFAVRGRDISFKKRWQLRKVRQTDFFKKLSLGTLLLFISTGSYIFYNTNIRNSYSTVATEKKYQAEYEERFKPIDNLPQPKIFDVKLNVELYPYERDYAITGAFMLTNTSDTVIPTIFVQKLPSANIELTDVTFSRVTTLDKNTTWEEFGNYGYQLKEPLQIGDSLKMSFKQTYTTKGFTENKDKRFVYNGTFFDNFQLPTFGYNAYIELEDEEDRLEYGLPPKTKTAKRTNQIAQKQARTGDDSKAIHFEITIGTANDQIGVAPGQLQKKWTENDRNYFHYKSTKPIINFYPITSARYELLTDKWLPKNDSLESPIDLEIYYHQGHEYNLDRMMESMQKSFTYYNQNFGAYPYQQMRIVETPRYLNRAQSFPTMVTYSESMGFIMDIGHAKEVDMPFFITAHEVAHQWWGLQVAAANVEGKKMILESLAQYSALMVLKETYSEEKVQQLLEMERNRYLEGRGTGTEQEMPLVLEDNQNHVYYGKGILNLYALQDYISEDSVNLALKRFVNDWNSFDGKLAKERYATTLDLLDYFSEVTPDSLQYVLADLFEKIIIFENSIETGTFEKTTNNQYQVNLALITKKYSIDSLGIKSEVPINDWIDIGIYGKNEIGKDTLIYLKKHQFAKSETSIQLITPQKPTSISIDPKQKLIDKDMADNEWMLLMKE